MDEIHRFYQDKCNESVRLSSQAGQIEYKTTMDYLARYCKKDMNILDACAGGGIYAFPLSELGCYVTAGDLIHENVQYIKKRNQQNPILKEIYEDSVLDLSRFPNESFDVVLNLGSYYHLCDDKDRRKSLFETLRILKSGGIYVISYINRAANYMAHFCEFKDNLSFLERYMEAGHIDNSSLFYSTTPELIEEDLEQCGLKLLHNIAVDGPIFLYRDIVDDMSKDDFDTFMRIHMNTCNKKSNLGYSEHGLVIAKKS